VSELRLALSSFLLGIEAWVLFGLWSLGFDHFRALPRWDLGLRIAPEREQRFGFPASFACVASQNAKTLLPSAKNLRIFSNFSKIRLDIRPHFAVKTVPIRSTGVLTHLQPAANWDLAGTPANAVSQQNDPESQPARESYCPQRSHSRNAFGVDVPSLTGRRSERGLLGSEPNSLLRFPNDPATYEN
jgi:hypothetical protein